ncbi:MAG: hypothetical protein K2N28_00510 [Muribaculaceae bacterium]|nr:hypothetical protein [Muribaculaceae bacterium]
MLILIVLFQLIVCLILATVIALPLAACLFYFSKRKKKRRALFGLLSPYVFIFSFYLVCLIGSLFCAWAFDTGCGMDDYWHTDLPNGYDIESIACDNEDITGNIRKNNRFIVGSVTRLAISGDTIYGEREAEACESYFALDTETGSLTQFDSLSEVQQVNPDISAQLTQIESFYYDSWGWTTPLGIIAFLIPTGLVVLLWFVIFKMAPWLLSRINKKWAKNLVE